MIGRGKPTSRRQRITKRRVITRLRLRHSSSSSAQRRELSKFLNDVAEILPANNCVRNIDRFITVPGSVANTDGAIFPAKLIVNATKAISPKDI